MLTVTDYITRVQMSAYWFFIPHRSEWKTMAAWTSGKNTSKTSACVLKWLEKYTQFVVKELKPTSIVLLGFCKADLVSFFILMKISTNT